MLGIVFVILIVIGMFLYFVMAVPQKPRTGTEIVNPTLGLSNEEAVLQFDEKYIDYLVFAIGGWKLHNPPLSSDTPKIKVSLDDGNEIYISEIIDGQVITEKKDTENEDIVITTTKEEIVDIISSGNMEEKVKESVQKGRTTLELKAGYTTLFSKGYLSIYKDLTGKSFTGSVIRIFGQG